MTTGTATADDESATWGMTVAAVRQQPVSGGISPWADRHRAALFAMVAVALLAAYNGQWRIDSDSALYLGLGRNLARGLGFSYRGTPHSLAFPGFPLLLAAAFRWWPAHAIAACLALVMASAGLALAATYRLVRLAAGRPAAVVVTTTVGLCHAFHGFALQVMPECLFVAAVMAVLAGHEGLFHRSGGAASRPADWCWFLAGVAVAAVTKPMMLPLLAAAVLTMPWRCRPLRGRSVVAAGYVVAVVAGLYWLDPRHPFTAAGSYEHLAAREIGRLPGRWRTVVLHNLCDLFGRSLTGTVVGATVGPPIINAVGGVTLVAAALATAGGRPLWRLWLVATLAKSVLLFNDDRYLIPVLPLLLLGLYRLLLGGSLNGQQGIGRAVATAAVLGLVVTVNAAGIAGTVRRQHARPFLAAYWGGRTAAMADIAPAVTAATPRDAVIFAPTGAARPFTFLADRDVFEPRSTIVAAAGRPRYALRPAGSGAVELDEFLSSLGLVAVPVPLCGSEAGPAPGWALYAVRPRPAVGPP